MNRLTKLVKGDKKVSEIKFVNLTVHDVVVLNEKGERVVIPPSGQVARIKTKETYYKTVGGLQIFDQEVFEIEGLPEPKEGVFYIVSMPLRLAARELGRTDVLSPDTGATAVRNEKGQVEYVTRLVR